MHSQYMLLAQVCPVILRGHKDHNTIPNLLNGQMHIHQARIWYTLKFQKVAFLSSGFYYVPLYTSTEIPIPGYLTAYYQQLA